MAPRGSPNEGFASETRFTIQSQGSSLCYLEAEVCTGPQRFRKASTVLMRKREMEKDLLHLTLQTKHDLFCIFLPATLQCSVT